MGGGLHLPPGARVSDAARVWSPTDADLVKTRNCPYGTTVMLIPVGVGPTGAQMSLGPQWVPCNRKCAYFEPDERDTPKKASGLCGKREDLRRLGRFMEAAQNQFPDIQEGLAAVEQIEDNQGSEG